MVFVFRCDSCQMLGVITNFCWLKNDPSETGLIILVYIYIEESHNSLPFLDVHVRPNDNKYITSVYRKPTFSGVYTNYDSFIPASYKSSLLSTLHIVLFPSAVAGTVYTLNLKPSDRWCYVMVFQLNWLIAGLHRFSVDSTNPVRANKMTSKNQWW